MIKFALDMTQDELFKVLVAHCKEYGFIFPSSEIYDGLAAVYDYGQMGSELKTNIKQYWWNAMTRLNENIVGIDSCIFMHPTIWKASGHVDAFNDPLIDNKDSKKRYRADVLIEDYLGKIEEKINKEVAKGKKKFGENFQQGGKMEKLSSFYDAFDTFLFTPTTTSKKVGAQIHDGNDSKRTMILVVIALIPCLLFGMFNVGYQHLLATGELIKGSMTCVLWWKAFGFGLLAVLPYIIVSYLVGLGIEFVVAQIKHEEVAEVFLVTGFIIPLIVPINTPLWMVAVATAFAVIFAKEVFGGTGYNIFNVALITRAFLFFAYPTYMTGDKVFIR